MPQSIAQQEPGWYYRLSSFFRKLFGKPVYKIPLHAGFSCPNRDGTIGKEGCSYCYNPSFAPFCQNKLPLTITEQLARGKKKKNGCLYLAYFQSYTNTYGPTEHLKNLYEEALAVPDVIGLSIATRPDCVSEEILTMLEEIAGKKHLWIEYGLQSAHDKTLQRINRGHSVACFVEAVEKTSRRGIFICAHIILGLPGESEQMMLETIDFLNMCGVDGVKFHHLQVIKNTPLAEEYDRGGFKVFNNIYDYIDLLCNCLERLSPETVIHRLATQAVSKDLLIAPYWSEGGGQIAAAVEQELKNRGTYQGYSQNQQNQSDK